jgi:alpha-beta hydrolase superfamily lysophospholipase
MDFYGLHLLSHIFFVAKLALKASYYKLSSRYKLDAGIFAIIFKEMKNVAETSEFSYEVDSIKVYGTLVKPIGNGPFPAVTMVAGSGPTDRDWNSPLLTGTNGSARLLAEALAQAGIASLRYDKRASGPHVKENIPVLTGNISMKSHIDELTGAMRTLVSHPYIRKDKIFALGNSEGTLHILHYVLQNPKMPFAGLVLTGLSGRSINEIIRSQLAVQAAALPNKEEVLALYDEATARFVVGEPAIPDPSLPQNFQMLIKSLEAPVNLPFARELWPTEGASLIKQVTLPTLIVIGKKDIQVDWQIDGKLLQKSALGHENISFTFPENANHVLKYEQKPRTELTAVDVSNNYNAPTSQLDPDALDYVLKWLISFC